MHLFARTSLAAALISSSVATPPAQAKDGPPPQGALDELRRDFTLGGAPVPPLVFRDMGDGNAADGKPMLVTVDAWAAIGSNQYADAIERHQEWTKQTSPSSVGDRTTETEKYRYLGATPDGLMVVLTINSTSDGSFAPATLHVLAGSVTNALDDGKPYGRVDVTTLARYSLGDGWTGKATLSGGTVTVRTESGAAYSQKTSENLKTIVVARP